MQAKMIEPPKVSIFYCIAAALGCSVGLIFRRDGMGVANECRTLRFPTVGGRWCIQWWQLWGKGKKSLPLGGGRDKR